MQTQTNLKKVEAELGFIHEKSAPYDHETNCFIDRECRTFLESVCTALIQSGAPPSFWGEAANHYTFTRNVIPRHPVEKEGKTNFLSANNIFENNDRPFPLKNLVDFGTQATCFLPPAKMEGGKGPGQKKSFDGVIVGYSENMAAYRVFDIHAQKIKEISFAFVVLSEGFYPFKEKKNWPEEGEEQPFLFFPTFDTLLEKTRKSGIYLTLMKKKKKKY